MHALLLGFGTVMLALAGSAVVLALARLALVQVRGLVRLSRQLADPHDQAGGRWEFTDCASPPGWALPPERRTGELEPWQR